MTPLEIREQTRLTPEAFALVIGTTRSAVASYEAGRRCPATRVAARYRAVEETLSGPVRSYGAFRGRPIELPDSAWVSAVPHRGTFRLPVHLDWSYRKGRDMALVDDRLAVYAQVLAEGKPSDIRFWIDLPELHRFLPELLIPRHLRGPSAEMLRRIEDPDGD
jgi:hypothetical protein